VKVGNQNVIDLADPRLPGGGDDAIGVTALVAGPAGVDQKGLLLGVTNSVAWPPSTSTK
jgi:hypothetical protein